MQRNFQSRNDGLTRDHDFEPNSDTQNAADFSQGSRSSSRYVPPQLRSREQPQTLAPAGAIPAREGVLNGPAGKKKLETQMNNYIARVLVPLLRKFMSLIVEKNGNLSDDIFVCFSLLFGGCCVFK
jgi:hypothetical protein